MNNYLIKNETASKITSNIKRLLDLKSNDESYTFGQLCDKLQNIASANNIVDNTIKSYTSTSTKYLREYSFTGCTNLMYVDIPNMIGDIPYRAFSNCTYLKRVNAANAANIGQYSFYLCNYIESLTFNKITKIDTYAFNKCYRLSQLILNVNKVVNLTSPNALYDTRIQYGTGYIYVPASLVDSYKKATNWIIYANQIRSIDDLPA